VGELQRLRREGVVEWVLIALGLVVSFAALPHRLENDGAERFAGIEALLHHGTLADNKRSLVMPLLSAPFLLLGQVVVSPEWWAVRFNTIVVGLAALTAFRLLGAGRDRVLLRKALLVLVGASFLTSGLRGYEVAISTGALVSVGVLALWRGRRVLGWTLLVIATVNIPGSIIGLALIAGVEAVRARRLRCAAPVVVAGALIMAESWIRRGSPLDTGYGGDHAFHTVMPYSGLPGYSYPLLYGLLSICFSFGRGLLFYIPGLALIGGAQTRALLGRYRLPVGLMFAYLVGLIAIYATWWSWYGGAAWGPRFFIIGAVPASVLIALRLEGAGRSAATDAVTLLVLTVSSWVAIVGAVGVATPDICADHDYALEALCWYTPEFSNVTAPLTHFPPLGVGGAVVVAYCALVFLWLAVPLARSLARRRPPLAPDRWLAGWRL